MLLAVEILTGFLRPEFILSTLAIRACDGTGEFFCQQKALISLLEA